MAYTTGQPGREPPDGCGQNQHGAGALQTAHPGRCPYGKGAPAPAPQTQAANNGDEPPPAPQAELTGDAGASRFAPQARVPGGMAAPQPLRGNAPIPFSLSRAPERVLPCALHSPAEGKSYAIAPDYRTVLMCLRRLCDPDLTELEKQLYLGRRFFVGHAPRDAAALFHAFVTGGADAADDVPVMDFEVDAEAIYASFRQQYGMDLLCETPHWAVFRALLRGLSEHTPFGARVRLRTLPDGDLPQEARAELARARERIAIPQRVSRAQTALLQELDRRLAAGEDPADVLLKMQEG